MGKDGERISSSASREMGVCDGVRQAEVRSDPRHLNHAQDFAPEESRSNLRRRNTVLFQEEMLAVRDST